MAFSPPLKLAVKKKANFTCCWCLNRNHKVDIHHIIPQAEDGPDTEENAAPLCKNCHDTHGGNPTRRKEIRERRDHWYDLCAQKSVLPLLDPDLYVPLFDSCEEISPKRTSTIKGTDILLQQQGIRVSNKESLKNNGAPTFSLFFSYADFPNIFPTSKGKTIRIIANFSYGLNINTEVYAHNDWSVTGVMNVFQNKLDLWILSGKSIAEENDQSRHFKNNMLIARKKAGNLLMILSIPTQTESAFQIQATLTNEVSLAIANYLQRHGFTEPFDMANANS